MWAFQVAHNMQAIVNSIFWWSYPSCATMHSAWISSKIRCRQTDVTCQASTFTWPQLFHFWKSSLIKLHNSVMNHFDLYKHSWAMRLALGQGCRTELIAFSTCFSTNPILLLIECLRPCVSLSQLSGDGIPGKSCDSSDPTLPKTCRKRFWIEVVTRDAHCAAKPAFCWLWKSNSCFSESMWPKKEKKSNYKTPSTNSP